MGHRCLTTKRIFQLYESLNYYNSAKSKSYILHVCIQKGSGIPTKEVWKTGNPCKQQTREKEAPWTVTSICDS